MKGLHFPFLLGIPGVLLATSYEPRIEEISHVISVDIPFVINEPSRTPIELPEFDNTDGTLMRIKIGFEGLFIENTFRTYPRTPEGGLLARYTVITTLDYRSQNGPSISYREGWEDVCQFDEPSNEQRFCWNDGVAETIVDETSFFHSWNPALVNDLQSDVVNEGVNETVVVKWPTETVIVPPDFSYEVPKREKLERAGGTIYFGNSYLSSPRSYDTGSGEYTGDLTVTYSYDAKTSLEYALEILAVARTAGETDVEIADLFYQQAIRAREGSYPGATLNENIRKVEYFGRGFHGASLIRSKAFTDISSLDPNNLANMAVPISEPVYNFLKEYGIYGAENENPQSTATDSDDARSGWGLGMAGVGLEEALRWEFQDPKPQEPPEELDSIFKFPETPENSEQNPLFSAGEIAIPTDEDEGVPSDLFFLNNQAGDVVHLSGSNDPAETVSASSVALHQLRTQLVSRFEEPSEFFIAIQGASVRTFSIPDLDDRPDPFQIDLGSGFVEHLEGEIIELPALPPDAISQGIFIKGVTPDTDGIQIRLEFAESGGALVSITEVVVKPIQDFFLRLGFESSASGLSLRVMGPSHQNPLIYQSTSFEDWVPFDTVDSFTGDNLVPLNLDTLPLPAFFKVLDEDAD